MKSFKDYQSNNPPSSNVEQDDEQMTAEQLTKKIAQAYNGKSSGNMFGKILEEAERSKRAGTLSNAEIDEFYRQFSPMLSVVQRKTLKRIVEKLKER